MKNVEIMKDLKNENEYFVREELFDKEWVSKRVEGEIEKSNLPFP